jgi:hypothetical protein
VEIEDDARVEESCLVGLVGLCGELGTALVDASGASVKAGVLGRGGCWLLVGPGVGSGRRGLGLSLFSMLQIANVESARAVHGSRKNRHVLDATSPQKSRESMGLVCAVTVDVLT